MAFKKRFLNLLRLCLMALVLIAAALVSAIGTIRLSMREPEATLPPLTGLTVDQAQQQLLPLQVQVKVEEELYSQEWEAGRIISQIPSAGNQLKTGQRVYVLVSLGAQKSPIPNLVGKRFRAAEITLFQHDLTPGEEGRVEKAGTEVGQVLAQEPLPTQGQAHGPVVSLLVSRGENPRSYLAPDFVGGTLAQVRKAVAEAGLPQPSLTYLTRKDILENTILSQVPHPGARVGARTIFELQVATRSERSVETGRSGPDGRP